MSVLVFILGFFVPEGYFAIGFDAGGVTTGPITVPFLLALYVGVVAVLGGRNRVSQGFGLVALASVGPITSRPTNPSPLLPRMARSIPSSSITAQITSTGWPRLR